MAFGGAEGREFYRATWTTPRNPARRAPVLRSGLAVERPAPLRPAEENAMKMSLKWIPLVAALSLPAAAAISPPGGLARGMAAPAGVEPAFALSAAGVQIYQCSALGADGWGWTYVAPDVTLYEGTRTIGTHKVPDLW